jgi:Cu/Ag efflux protein CusF
MMKVFLVGVLAAVWVALAQPSDLQGEVVGVVQSVAADPHKLSVRDTDNRVWTFTANDAMKVRVQGREAKLADLKTGERVDVVFSMDGYVPKTIQTLPEFKSDK